MGYTRHMDIDSLGGRLCSWAKITQLKGEERCILGLAHEGDHVFNVVTPGSPRH